MDYNILSNITVGQTNMEFAAEVLKECNEAMSKVFTDIMDAPYVIEIQVRDNIPAAQIIPDHPDIGIQIPCEGLLHNSAYVYITHNTSNVREKMFFIISLARTVLERNLYTSVVKPNEGTSIYIYNKRAFSTKYFEVRDYPWIVEAEKKGALLSKELMLN
jgi:hypothetical protein